LDLEGPLRRWLTEVAAEQTLVIPLLGKDSLVGAVFVDNRRGGKAFSSEDRTLIEGLAFQAVIAIENARLVNDLKRSRQQIMRTERLGTLGTLAAGLAHEINNPLVSIRTFLSMAPAKRKENDSEFWGDYHSLATQEVERIRRLVETMQQLGRDGANEASREVVQVDEILRQVLRLVEPEATRKCVNVRSEIAPMIPPILVARDQIHQLIMNLLLNALYSAGEDGSVVVKIWFDGGTDSILTEVSDNGVGIAAEDLERIFDPFFTTKSPDEGTGLGLMICHRIVTEHSGSIEVNSTQGDGASFLVSLPRNPAQVKDIASEI
jgi:signal transduction histidine kinase